MHHFDGTAREAEGHWPERAFARPVDKIIDFGDGVFDFVVDGDSAGSSEDFIHSIKSIQLDSLFGLEDEK